MIKKMAKGPSGITVHRRSTQGSGGTGRDMVMAHTILHTETFIMANGNVG